MTIGSQLNQILGNLPGKSLTKEINGSWQELAFSEIAKELSKDVKAPRILSVENTRDRVKRRNPSNENGKKDEESFEIFSIDPACNDFMIKRFEFPAYLFTKSWFKSNGFAGSMKLAAGGNISWFRVLVKMVKGMEKYYWHEMTFFIHQLDGPDNFVTVICFEVPDDPVDDNTDPSTFANGSEEAGLKPYNFLKELCSELNGPSRNLTHDWRFIQSLLLRQATAVVDRGVWACSKAVRELEKSRLDSTIGLNKPFDFPRAHDLLRHALHNTEALQVASQTLNAWLDDYCTGQKSEQQSQAQPNSRAPPQPQPQHQLQPLQYSYRDDTPLPLDTCYQDLRATLQLLTNLTRRSASNDARLRNEINLAFNVVNQQDTKAMRIISIVTLTFLPATFVSTLFSMTFFRQPSDQKEWGVSPKIWIYFVISVPLTGFSIALWVWGARIWRRLDGNRKRKLS